jgi:hypothetical protein
LETTNVEENYGKNIQNQTIEEKDYIQSQLKDKENSPITIESDMEEIQ